MVLEINDQNFDNEVIKSKIPVVVDFWAPWCGPCRALAPITEKLSEAYAGKVKFCKINVDENQEMTRKYKVMSIPLVVFFKDGVQKDSSLGLVPEAALRFPLTARSPRREDRYQKIHAPDEQKVFEMIRVAGFPPALRNLCPVLVNGDGKIIWAWGAPVADPFRVRQDDTAPLCRIEII